MPLSSTMSWLLTPLLAVALSTPAQAAVCLLPLGDSITQAPVPMVSYRYWLWEDLVDAGYDVDFVGSKNNGYGGGTPSYPDADFDRDHEGHAGWRAEQVRDRLPGWMRSTPYVPDVVLMHLGTNDVFAGQSASSTVAEIDAIIDELRTANPDVTVLLAQIIPVSWVGGNRQIELLNRRLALYAADASTATSPVVLVDQYTDFNAAWMTVDGVHPNELGEQFMADRWLAALVDVWGGLSEHCP